MLVEGVNARMQISQKCAECLNHTPHYFTPFRALIRTLDIGEGEGSEMSPRTDKKQNFHASHRCLKTKTEFTYNLSSYYHAMVQLKRSKEFLQSAFRVL